MTSRSFEAVKVTENVYWVGAIDWDIRDFHGYRTGQGTTYNAYLILGEKLTLVDTVKAPFCDEMFERIASIVDPCKIDYIVSNHSEMDHTGALPHTVHVVKPEKIFASKMGARALASHFHMDREIQVVADGETLDLGGLKLSFAETRMCHWPDSMVSYLHEDKLLFSQDAFGMHLASYERFADELDARTLKDEAAKYYANILLHLPHIIEKTIAKLEGLGLELSVVAPDHGPIYRRGEDITDIIGSYARWNKQSPSDKAVVVYDTMWHSTASMARAIGEGLSAGGMKVRMMPAGAVHRSDIVTELLDAGALLVGSPTLNNGLFPTIAETMCYITGLKPRNLIGAAFGSFGWSGEASRKLHEMLAGLGVKMVAPPLRVNYVPDEDALEQCRQLGEYVARANQAQLAGKEIPTLCEEPEKKPAKPGKATKCKIDINSGVRKLAVEPGLSVFKALGGQDIMLPTICGGEGLCGCCKITVLQGASEITPAERQQLTGAQLQANIRLACQVVVREDMKIIVPEESLGAQQFQGLVEEITELNHDIKRLRIKLIEPGQLEFRPGQYIKFNVPTSIEPGGISRAYSFAASPSQAKAGYVELMIRRVPGGVCTGWVFQHLQAGDAVSFAGPFGSFALSDSDSEMIWIGGGSGLSPFWSMLQYMRENNIARKCTLFFGAVQKRDLLLMAELQDLQTQLDWFTFVPALSAPAEGDNWPGEVGLVTDVVARHIKDGSKAEAYLCGSPGMIDAAINTLLGLNFEDSRIFRDDHTHTNPPRKNV